MVRGPFFGPVQLQYEHVSSQPVAELCCWSATALDRERSASYSLVLLPGVIKGVGSEQSQLSRPSIYSFNFCYLTGQWKQETVHGRSD